VSPILLNEYSRSFLARRIETRTKGSVLFGTDVSVPIS
jgi:hypothetical protein